MMVLVGISFGMQEDRHEQFPLQDFKRHLRLRLRRLLFSGAVHPRAPWSRGADPLPALAATLSEAQRRAWGEDSDVQFGSGLGQDQMEADDTALEDGFDD